MVMAEVPPSSSTWDNDAIGKRLHVIPQVAQHGIVYRPILQLARHLRQPRLGKS